VSALPSCFSLLVGNSLPSHGPEYTPLLVESFPSLGGVLGENRSESKGFPSLLFRFLKTAAELRQRGGAINEGADRTSGLNRE
jgi:hypothetical protein